jgi:hypothetical protein
MWIVIADSCGNSWKKAIEIKNKAVLNSVNTKFQKYIFGNTASRYRTYQ